MAVRVSKLAEGDLNDSIDRTRYIIKATALECDRDAGTANHDAPAHDAVRCRTDFARIEPGLDARMSLDDALDRTWDWLRAAA